MISDCTQTDGSTRLVSCREDGGRTLYTDLLTKAYTWPSVEGQVDERVGDKILPDSVIQESFWVKLMR